jgi:hypothetical protein
MITPEYFPVLDFWFYKVGVNVWPADTRNKSLSNSWKARQDEPMSPEEFEEMKKKGDYIRGAAVITGKIWRGDNVGYYLNGVDLDNQKAIEEVCYSLKEGRTITLEELADQTLVEHHLDNPDKIHLYIYSKHAYKNKASDSGRQWFNKDTMPAIEVKGSRSLMFCTPSMHKGGHRYQFVKENQNTPGISDNLEGTIDTILSRHNIEYLSKTDNRLRDKQRSNDQSRTVNEGSRHSELLREMNAILFEQIRRKPLEEIRKAKQNLSHQ